MDERNRPGLTRNTIIGAALRLLGDTGLDGLTVRRLAAELGVQSPALYWHFRSKQDLLNGMADAIITARGMTPPRVGESWQEWLARRTREYHVSLCAYRDGARVVAGARALTPATIATFDRELAILVARGFTPALALHTIAALTRYVNGFVLQEQSVQSRAAAPADAPPPAIAGISAPLLQQAIRDGGSLLGEQAFEHGLCALLDGTAAALARQHPAG